MGLFNKKRKSEVTEVDVYKEHGNEVHVFDGPDGKVEVSKVNMADFLPTGEQWCPHCHVQCEKRDDGKWFECSECGYSITAEDAELFGSYPTEASTYD